MTGPGVYAVTADGMVKEVSRGATDAPFLCPNFPAFLPDGHLIVSESGNYGQNDGKLLIISPDSTTRVLSATASALRTAWGCPVIGLPFLFVSLPFLESIRFLLTEVAPVGTIVFLSSCLGPVRVE